jgi:hypothetical protein
VKTFLKRGGKLIAKNGKLVKTSDPSSCPCCKDICTCDSLCLGPVVDTAGLPVIPNAINLGDCRVVVPRSTFLFGEGGGVSASIEVGPERDPGGADIGWRLPPGVTWKEGWPAKLYGPGRGFCGFVYLWEASSECWSAPPGFVFPNGMPCGKPCECRKYRFSARVYLGNCKDGSLCDVTSDALSGPVDSLRAEGCADNWGGTYDDCQASEPPKVVPPFLDCPVPRREAPIWVDHDSFYPENPLP